MHALLIIYFEILRFVCDIRWTAFLAHILKNESTNLSRLISSWTTNLATILLAILEIVRCVHRCSRCGCVCTWWITFSRNSAFQAFEPCQISIELIILLLNLIIIENDIRLIAIVWILELLLSLIAIYHLILVPSKWFLRHLGRLRIHCILLWEWCLLIKFLRILLLLNLLNGRTVHLIWLLAINKIIFLIIISLSTIDYILESCRFALWSLCLITICTGTIFLSGYNGFHMSKFLFKCGKHLLGNLKLNCSWVMLNGQCVWAQVFYQGMILPIIIALTHLKDHILVTAQFLAVCYWCWHGSLRSSCQVSYLRCHAWR